MPYFIDKLCIFTCFIMKRKVESVCVRVFFAYILVYHFLIDLVRSEELQCAKWTLLRGQRIKDPERKHYCEINSEEQSQPKLNCTLWDVGPKDSEDGNDCLNLKFSPSMRSAVSGVEIHPMVRSRKPYFKIKFRSINWHFMQYRMQLQDNNKESVCHKLEFPSRPDPSLQVSFACMIFKQASAGKTVELLVDAGDGPSDIQGHSHFLMKLPSTASSEGSCNDFRSVVVVDISKKPYLHVYWPMVPKKCNVTEYKVQISDDEVQVVGESSCHRGYCSLEMFAGYFPRNVTISVKPDHEICSYFECKSISPLIVLDFSLPTFYVVLMVLAPVVGMLFIVFSVYYFCCYPPRDPLKVLILYDATTKEHTFVVRQLIKYLEHVCRIHCLEGEREIPCSESKKLDKWLKQAFGKADAVLYIASPEPQWDLRFCEYPGVVYGALQLIAQHKKCMILNRPGRFLVAVPPYPSSIPKELVKAPRFHLPEDLSWLLWSIYNQHHCWLQAFIWLAKAYFGLCCCPGPMSAYNKHGKKLDQKMIETKNKMEEDENIINASLSEWSGWTLYMPQGDKTDKESLPEYYREMFEEILSRMQTRDSPQDTGSMQEIFQHVFEEMQHEIQVRNSSPDDGLLASQPECPFGINNCTIHHTMDEEDHSLHATVNLDDLLGSQHAYEHGEISQVAEMQNTAPHETLNVCDLAYQGELGSIARVETPV